MSRISTKYTPEKLKKLPKAKTEISARIRSLMIHTGTVFSRLSIEVGIPEQTLRAWVIERNKSSMIFTGNEATIMKFERERGLIWNGSEHLTV